MSPKFVYGRNKADRAPITTFASPDAICRQALRFPSRLVQQRRARVDAQVEALPPAVRPFHAQRARAAAQVQPAPALHPSIQRAAHPRLNSKSGLCERRTEILVECLIKGEQQDGGVGFHGLSKEGVVWLGAIRCNGSLS